MAGLLLPQSRGLYLYDFEPLTLHPELTLSTFLLLLKEMVPFLCGKRLNQALRTLTPPSSIGARSCRPTHKAPPPSMRAITKEHLISAESRANPMRRTKEQVPKSLFKRPRFESVECSHGGSSIL